MLIRRGEILWADQAVRLGGRLRLSLGLSFFQFLA